MATDPVGNFIKGRLDGKRFRQTSYALDRGLREATLAPSFEQSVMLADSDAVQRIAA